MRSRARRSDGFVIAVLALPLIYVPGIGNWVREPKLIVFFVGAALAMIATARRVGDFGDRVDHGARAVAALAVMVLALQLATAPIVTNFGSFAIAVGITISAVGTGWVVHRTNTCRSLVATVSAFVAVALAVCALFEIYVGISLFGRALFAGLPVGGRNYLPTVLVAMLPVVEARLLLATWRTRAPRVAAVIGLLAIVVASIAFRTRAVWLILAIQALVLWSMALRHRPDRRFRMLAIAHTLLLVAAVTMIVAIPTRLHWTSADHPYLDSLASIGGARPSGRDSIWRVVTSEIAEKPILGIGAGQYPVLARTLVAHHAIDPEVFAFSTTDSPAFNDYLQTACELGVVGGALFVILYLVIPVGLLVELFRRRVVEIDRLPFCLGLVSIAVGAGFSNSVDRPEQVAIFAVYVAIALRMRPARDQPGIVEFRQFRIGMGIVAVIPFVIGAALLTRFVAFPNPVDRDRLVLGPSIAYTVWPWDKYWNATAVGSYLSRGADPELRRSHARARLRYWPGDPDASLISAYDDESAHDLPLARKRFRDAVFEVPGGRCRLDHLRQLEAFLRRHELAAEDRDLSIRMACENVRP